MFEKVSADFNFSYTITFILLHLSLKEICMHTVHPYISFHAIITFLFLETFFHTSWYHNN